MGFSNFILNENRSFLGQKIGDILSALQSLQQDSANLGNRQIIQICKNIVVQIKKILNDSWPDSEMKTLKVLQKVGVALMKSIDSNADMAEIVGSAVQELEQTTKSLEMPINDIGSEESIEDTDRQTNQQ